MPAPEPVKQLIETLIAATARLVYDLYHLTDDEIALVEGAI